MIWGANHEQGRVALEAYFHSLLRGERRGLKPALERTGLRLLSLPYGWAVRGRNWMYDRGWAQSYAAAIPVISVGNLTVGGTGKTPCVEYVARFLRQREVRVAILSRGYGAQEGCNDEALVLEENLPDVPHLQGPDRVALAQVAAEELESEVLVLDDGLQHRRLRRDLELVLIDATCPWGYGYLLPRGLLREPMSGLKRAHAVLITRCDQVEPNVIHDIQARVQRCQPHLPVIRTTHRPAQWINASRTTLPLEQLQDRPWTAFCGLGNPEAFRRTLTRLGGNVTDWRTFPDHHNYTRSDVDNLQRWADQQAAETVMLTTQKDLVKIRLDHLGGRPLWALNIQLHLETGQDILEEKLLAVLP
jgi:tetraacyldisaccharide 4'-kinase